MIDSVFKKEVIRLDKSVDRSFFPENFSNEIYYSTVNYSSDDSILYKSNFSIKYVLSGREFYSLGGKEHVPRAGEYLLINDGREVETRPSKGSEGISIFLESGLINEVYHSLVSTEEYMLDNAVFDPAKPNPEFLEHTFRHRDRLGDRLQQLRSVARKSAEDKVPLPKASYYWIAEGLIQSQKKVRLEIGNIKRIKKSTRIELYRRVLIAKDYIHDTSNTGFNLDLVAKHAGLSKYHLIRTFHSAFGVTPHQYHVFCKVNTAKNYLLNDPSSLEVIAYLSGFNDVFSFSKTFKKWEGMAPSEFRRKYKRAIFDK